MKGKRRVKEYKKMTAVFESPLSLNVHEPKKDLKRKGPLVILIAVALGRLKETYSVTIPRPSFATQYAFIPLPASVAPSINAAFLRKVSQFNRCIILCIIECFGLTAIDDNAFGEFYAFHISPRVIRILCLLMA